MKKQFYILFIICAVLLSAITKSQSLQLYDVSGNVPNGTIFHIWGDTITGNIIKKVVGVKNISTSAVTVDLKKIETSLLPGTSCQICFAGQCYLSSVFVSPNTATLTPNDTNSSGSVDYKPKGHLGESIITLVFFNTGDTNDSAWVVVHFHGSPAGITENDLAKTSISNAYPNPAVNYTSFDYSFAQGTTSAKFVLSDILGSKVKEETLNNMSGNLIVNTSDIEAGIYFYSFYENDRLVLTKKIIVKH